MTDGDAAAPGRAPPLSAARLVVLGLAAVAWMLPWVEAVARMGGLARTETGASRTGAVAALAFVGAWGLALSVRLARTRNGLVRGEAATGAFVALLSVALVALEHPWMPGGARRSAWIPIFLPLALLCLLDVIVRMRRVPAGGEVTSIRAGAALLAALALAIAGQPLPAAAAAWLAAGGLASLLASTFATARRAQDGLALLAAVALLVAPELLAAIEPPPLEIRVVSPAGLAYRALAAALVLLTGFAAFAPRRPDAAP